MCPSGLTSSPQQPRPFYTRHGRLAIMSNAAVGNIYQQIILDVIEASRVDLEENGVDEGILDELKQVSHFSSSV